MAYIPTKPKSIGKSGKYKSSARLGGGAKIKSSWGSSGAGVIPEFDIEGKPTGRFGFAGSGVTAVYSGKKSDKSSDSLITGTFTGAEGTTTKSYSLSSRVIPSDVSTGRSDYNPRRDALFNATNRVNPVSDSGIVYSSRDSSWVNISPSLVNKYNRDTSSPMREVTGSDVVYVQSPRQSLINDWGSGGSMDYLPFDRFSAGAIEILPSINADFDRRDRQETFFGNLEGNSGVGVLRSAGDKLGVFSESLRARAEDLPSGAEYYSLKGSLGLGALLTGYGGALLKYPSNVGRDVIRFESGFSRDEDVRSLFTGRERLVAGVNTGVRAFTFVYGASRGAGFGVVSGKGMSGFDKISLGAGLVGVGFMVADVVNSPTRSVAFSKAYGYGAEVTGLGLLGGFGGQLGVEFNPYLKLTPNFVSGKVAGSGFGSVRKDMLGNTDVLGKYFKGTYVDTSYGINYAKSNYILGRGGGSGAKYYSVKMNTGKTYFTSSYRGLFHNYYARGTIAGNGFTRVNYFRGDVVKFSNSFRSGGVVLGENNLLMSGRKRLTKPDFTLESSRSESFSNVLSKGWSGGSKDVVSSEFVIFTPENAGSITRATKTGLFFGDNPSSKVSLVKTKYIPVDYIPKVRVIKVTGGDGVAFVNKPSTAKASQFIDVKRFFGFVKGEGNWIDLTGGSGGLAPQRFSIPNSVSVKPVFTPLSNVVISKTNIPVFDTGIVSGRNVSFLLLPQFSTRNVLDSSLSLSNRLNFDVSSRATSGLVSTSVSSVLSPSVSFSPSSSLASFSVTRSVSRVVNVNVDVNVNPSFNTGLSFNPNFNPIIPPTSSPLYFPSGLGGFGSKSSGFLSGVSFNPEYVGSVMAGDRRLFGKMPSKLSVSSGLAVRPLLRINKRMKGF